MEGRARCRCGWANPENPRYIHYHDAEWGVPEHDDRMLFEMLILEGFQAGLSWECILNKRENFRRAFDNFDWEKVGRLRPRKAGSPGAGRGASCANRRKIAASVGNARAFAAIRQEWGSFDAYLWHWTGGRSLREVGRVTSPLSDAISKDLQKRGMKFVGSTIVYAYLQAVGGHLVPRTGMLSVCGGPGGGDMSLPPAGCRFQPLPTIETGPEGAEGGITMEFAELTAQARRATEELLEKAHLETGDIFVVGCSSSEIMGGQIGHDSSMEAAAAVLAGVLPPLQEQGVYLAAQCCEHLNRAIVLERGSRPGVWLPDRGRHSPAPCGRQLGHQLLAGVPGPRPGGRGPRRRRHGHRRHAYRHASAPGGGAGTAEPGPHRAGYPALRPYPPALHRRGPGRLQ